MNSEPFASRVGGLFLIAVMMLGAGAFAPAVGQATSSALSVIVTNSNSVPVPVNVRNVVVGSQNRTAMGADADVALQNGQASHDSANIITSSTRYTVVRTITCFAQVPTGQRMLATAHIGNTPMQVEIPMQYQGTSGSVDWLSGAVTGEWIVPAKNVVYVHAFRTSSSGNALVDVNFSGYTQPLSP